MRFIVISGFAVAFAGAVMTAPAMAANKNNNGVQSAAQTASDTPVCPCPVGTSPNGDDSCFNRGNGANGGINGNGHQGGNNGQGQGNSDQNNDRDQCKSTN